MRFLKRLGGDRSGATAIEYGLIAALIAVACIIAVQMLGINIADTFWTLAGVMVQA